MKERVFLLNFLFRPLDFFLSKPLHGLTIDRPSHVSLLHFRAAFLFRIPTNVLMEPSSFAIWHSNKVVRGIAAGLWVASASIIIWGESSPSILWKLP